jgi:hypothetical protein
MRVMGVCVRVRVRGDHAYFFASLLVGISFRNSDRSPQWVHLVRSEILRKEEEKVVFFLFIRLQKNVPKFFAPLPSSLS